VAYWLLKLVLTPVFLLLWRVRVEGREHIPADGPAVLAANHQSFCDSLFLPLVVPRKVIYLAKAEYFDSPKTAWFFRAVGQIPIRRGGGKESERALETAKDELLAGHLIAVYPEGTRSHDPWVHRGRTGVARLSRECGLPVIPVGIAGTVDVQPIGSRVMRPFRTVTVRFGEPMRMQPATDPSDPMADHDHADCRAFTDTLMHEIARLSGHGYVDEYVTPRQNAVPAGQGRGTGEVRPPA
jgi:1-acyl-sn-glycerol-3-phosphate acyltransferase